MVEKRPLDLRPMSSTSCPCGSPPTSSWSRAVAVGKGEGRGGRRALLHPLAATVEMALQVVGKLRTEGADRRRRSPGSGCWFLEGFLWSRCQGLRQCHVSFRFRLGEQWERLFCQINMLGVNKA